MLVKILDRHGAEFSGSIVEAQKSELKKVKNWNFQWSKLFDNHSWIFKLVCKSEIIGLIKIKWENPDHFVLANIELSPDNIGSNGTYKNATEILIAYSALLSFKLNKGPYKGFWHLPVKGIL